MAGQQGGSGGVLQMVNTSRLTSFQMAPMPLTSKWTSNNWRGSTMPPPLSLDAKTRFTCLRATIYFKLYILLTGKLDMSSYICYHFYLKQYPNSLTAFSTHAVDIAVHKTSTLILTWYFKVPAWKTLATSRTEMRYLAKRKFWRAMTVLAPGND